MQNTFTILGRACRPFLIPSTQTPSQSTYESDPTRTFRLHILAKQFLLHFVPPPPRNVKLGDLTRAYGTSSGISNNPVAESKVKASIPTQLVVNEEHLLVDQTNCPANMLHPYSAVMFALLLLSLCRGNDCLGVVPVPAGARCSYLLRYHGPTPVSDLILHHWLALWLLLQRRPGFPRP